MRWKLTTGCFAGEIIEEEQILNVSFEELDTDLQGRIRQYAEDHKIEDKEDAKERYEQSWESEETEEEPTLDPASKW